MLVEQRLFKTNEFYRLGFCRIKKDNEYQIMFLLSDLYDNNMLIELDKENAYCLLKGLQDILEEK